MLPADSTIPKESRKILKLNSLSNFLAQNTHTAAKAAKTVRATTSAPRLFFFWKSAGRILSSLMAYITLGLLSSSALMYANTLRKRQADNILSAFTRKIFVAIMAAIFG